MRLRLVIAPALLLLSCDSPLNSEADTELQEASRVTVVFQAPGDANATVRTLWQRSYPKEYSELLGRAKEFRDREDSFGVQIDIPDSELTPGTFGLLGWGRAIVPRVFDELGYPLEDGAEADYEAASGYFKITYSPRAIESFHARFPEFKPIQNEQGSSYQPTTRHSRSFESRNNY